MEEHSQLPELYTGLADWFHLLTHPKDYAEEAQIYRRAIQSACEKTPRTLLELGSGGGNNASHLKAYFQLTLVDISPAMLRVSRGLNPECEHVLGDMRTVRLGRAYDAVFVHDAIMYMTSERDLSSAIQTAYIHTRPGGVALFAPDCIRETFKPYTKHGGHDHEHRSLRYLEWIWDSDSLDTTYEAYMVYLIREDGGQIRCQHEKHVLGLFSEQDWLRLMSEAGFQVSVLPFEHSELEPVSTFMFLGLKDGIAP